MGVVILVGVMFESVEEGLDALENSLGFVMVATRKALIVRVNSSATAGARVDASRHSSQGACVAHM